MALQPWQKVWREGYAPNLPTAGLEILAVALRIDDQRLTQGATTTPPPLMVTQDWPVEAADAIAFVGWMDDPRRVTVGEVELFFAEQAFAADRRLGEPAACRHFLNWYDNTPRHVMRALLAAEVHRTLYERASEAANRCPWCDNVLAGDPDEVGCPCSSCGWGEGAPAGHTGTTEEF